MSRKKLLFALAAACIIPAAVASAQTLEYTETTPTFETGGRFTGGVDIRLVPKVLSMSVSEELRLESNFTNLRRSYTTVGIAYKPLDWLKTGLDVSYMAHHSASNGWGSRFRGTFYVTESLKLDRLKFSLREKIQATYRLDAPNLYEEPQLKWIAKARLKMSYDLPASHFTPYFSAEARFLLNGVSPKYFEYDYSDGRWSNPDPKYTDFYFSRMRFNLGTRYKTGKGNELDLEIIGDLNYDLDFDFNKQGKQKVDSSTSSGYAPYMFLDDSYFVGIGISYWFKLK